MNMNRLFVLLGVTMSIQVVCMLLSVDATTATIVTMGANLAVLFYVMRGFNKGIGGILGTPKIKWQCLICQGNKFDSTGTCHRCGSKSRKPA